MKLERYNERLELDVEYKCGLKRRNSKECVLSDRLVKRRLLRKKN